MLASASYAVVLADARPDTLLARASYAVVFANARPAALLARASSAVVLADASTRLFCSARGLKKKEPQKSKSILVIKHHNQYWIQDAHDSLPSAPQKPLS